MLWKQSRNKIKRKDEEVETVSFLDHQGKWEITELGALMRTQQEYQAETWLQEQL